MHLRGQLKAIDGPALEARFLDLSTGSWGRLHNDEPPVEYFDITSRYPIVQALANTCFTGMFNRYSDPHRAGVVSSGAFMAMAALGSYATAHGSPHLEAIEVDNAKLDTAFESFHDDLNGGYEAALEVLRLEFPFVSDLFDLAFDEAVKSDFVKPEHHYFVDGALRAAGTLIAYSEPE